MLSVGDCNQNRSLMRIFQTCVDLEFDLKEPVTFHLSEGSGPVFLTGMHDVLSYWEDDLSLFSDSEVINECGEEIRDEVTFVDSRDVCRRGGIPFLDEMGDSCQ